MNVLNMCVYAGCEYRSYNAMMMMIIVINIRLCSARRVYAVREEFKPNLQHTTPSRITPSPR